MRESHLPVNFFEYQERARRRTVVYLLLFAAAVAVVLVVTNAVVLGTFYVFDDRSARVAFGQWLRAHPAISVWTTLAVLGIVCGASAYRIAQLAGGGGRIARELGGRYVESTTDDPLRRELRNIVEEMALAAGMPVPSVYVLENEDGINALAVGFGTADAAIAVTQGALVRLDRDELQGVVAHELSHVLNGDTRLSTQLIGALYGVMAIGLIGRLALRARYADDARLALAAFAPGVALTVVGYVGLLCGRLMQAAVSRSRESLADACAVQFTRNPAGLAGALKKIAVAPGQGILLADCEQVSHMLIVDGRKLFDQVFATHPPLLERIKALDPHFDVSELARIKLRPVTIASAAKAARADARAVVVSPAAVVASIGRPDETQMALVERVQAAIPEPLRRVAYSRTHAPALVLALALNKDASDRARQLARLRTRVPESLRAHIDAIASMVDALAPQHRLPLVSIAFPALRERPAKELQALVAAIEEIERMDGRFDFLDYALLRWLRVQLAEAAAPSRSRLAAQGSRVAAEASVLLSLVAQAGDRDEHAAQNAYQAGITQWLGANAPPYAPPDPWVAAFDRALDRLDAATPSVKQSLIEALVVTILHDRRVTITELELLRAICASLHCPIPPLDAAPSARGRNDEAPNAAA